MIAYFIKWRLPAASSGVSGFRKSLTYFTASGGELNPERLNIFFAYDTFQQYHWRIEGIHLHFKDNASHAVYTYLDNYQKWSRRYSIQLKVNEQDIEIAVLFKAKCDFLNFMKYTPLMEHIVDSNEDSPPQAAGYLVLEKA